MKNYTKFIKRLKKKFTYIQKHYKNETIEDYYTPDYYQMTDGDLIGTMEDLIKFIKKEIK